MKRSSSGTVCSEAPVMETTGSTLASLLVSLLTSAASREAAALGNGILKKRKAPFYWAFTLYQAFCEGLTCVISFHARDDVMSKY